MPPKALTRCDLCKNWQAIYIVEDPQFGKIKVCHKCWQSRYKPKEEEKTLNHEEHKDHEERKR